MRWWGKKKRPVIRALGGLCVWWPLLAHGAELAPFETFDQSPLVQIFGLPSPGNARILPPGQSRAGLALDLASNFAGDSTSREAIRLDGETLRTTFSYSRGLGNRCEAGLQLPLVHQSGGFLDGVIDAWHSFFGLYDGGRQSAPKNRLLYVYNRDGTDRLKFTRSGFGVGDLRMTGGCQLLGGEKGALALRGMLKFPTGDSAALLGSGSTDLALWLTAQRDLQPGKGLAAVFGSLGGLAMTRGEVLADQQRHLVGFGSLGAGWSPLESVAFKLQFSCHTPFYRESELRELNRFSTLLVMGGTVAFSARTALDIGVSEDVAENRSPDLAFNLALTTRF